MGNVLSFGELLLRLSPDMDGQWLANSSMPIHVGGAELNVARALALWKIPVKYCTGLPVITSHRNSWLISCSNGDIDASAIQYGGQRVGIYYLPQGLDVKNAGVIYDRAESSFARLQTGTISLGRYTRRSKLVPCKCNLSGPECRCGRCMWRSNAGM